MKIRLRSNVHKDELIEVAGTPNLLNADFVYAYKNRLFRFTGYIFDMDLMEFEEVQTYGLLDGKLL